MYTAFKRTSMLFGGAVLLLSVGCRPKVCVNMALISTHSVVNEGKQLKKEFKEARVVNWEIMGIPLGPEVSPRKAFNKLNYGAIYINNLQIINRGFYFSIPLSEDISIGVSKEAWVAKGTVVTAAEPERNVEGSKE